MRKQDCAEHNKYTIMQRYQLETDYPGCLQVTFTQRPWFTSKSGQPAAVAHNFVTLGWSQLSCAFYLLLFCRDKKVYNAFKKIDLSGNQKRSFFSSLMLINSFSQVKYLPMMDSSPTNMVTVQAILQKSFNMANELILEPIAVCYDQLIYVKAQEIRW